MAKPIKSFLLKIVYYGLLRTCKIQSTSPLPPQYVLGIWHEDLPSALWFFQKYKMTLFVSLSNDANLFLPIMEALKYTIIRGSTSKGFSNLRFLLKEANKGNSLGMALDGPKGPRRIIAPGTQWLCKNSRLPYVHAEFEYTRFWKLNTWDQMKIPKPFSNIKLIFKAKDYDGSNIP